MNFLIICISLDQTLGVRPHACVCVALRACVRGHCRWLGPCMSYLPSYSKPAEWRPLTGNKEQCVSRHSGLEKKKEDSCIQSQHQR